MVRLDSDNVSQVLELTQHPPTRHCVLQGRLVSLKQDPTHLYYKVSAATHISSRSPNTNGNTKPNNTNNNSTADLLKSYFSLSHSLATLYSQWSVSDANFARRAPAFTGIRILNQDAWEALVAFICSSNNNISRISQMVHKLCVHYGPYVESIDGEAFHDFPRPEALAGGSKVEAHLRELGFGYRAKYIAETARIVATERPKGWLTGLRNPECPAAILHDDEPSNGVKSEGRDGILTYKAAQEALLELTGVGPKVADCVCLMGLGWGEAVPVDTHVWQIAQRDYAFGKGKGGGGKTFSKAMYDAVGDHFRKIWGLQAGWAQSVLFTANLKSFSEQAAGAKTKKGATTGGITNPEKVEVEVVKVEESQEVLGAEAGVVSSRKRRRVNTESVILKDENGAGEKTVTTRVTTRSSKRKRAPA